MYKLFVATRYLWRNWLNWVGVAAVAIAVCVPICVLSVMKGFDQEIRTRSRETLADLIVSPRTDYSFEGYAELTRRIEKLEHVESVAPEYAGVGLVKVGPHRLYAQFRGIDLQREKRSSNIGKYYRDARAKLASEKLQWFLGADMGTLETLGASFVRELASSLQKDNFERLPDAHKKALKKALAAKQIDLAECQSEAAKAEPEWVAVDDPKKYAPAFVGIELAILGRGSLGQLERLPIGDECLLIIPTSEKDSSRAFQKCRVAGYVKSGLYDYDQRTIILPLEVLQKRLDKEGHATGINIRLDDFKHAPAVRAQMWGTLSPEEFKAGIRLVAKFVKPKEEAAYERIMQQYEFIEANKFGGAGESLHQVCFSLTRNLLTVVEKEVGAGGWGQASPEEVEKLLAFKRMCVARAQAGYVNHLVVSTWQDKRTNVLRAVNTERKVMAFILSFVAVIAGFLILSILHTTVLVKTKDIGILKAIGGSVSGILSLFLVNGLLIGLFGAAIGAFGGVYISMRLNEIEDLLSAWVGYRLFPHDIYYLDQLPVDKHPVPSAVIIAVCALVTCVVASALPAWKASRMDAVETLRYE